MENDNYQLPVAMAQFLELFENIPPCFFSLIGGALYREIGISRSAIYKMVKKESRGRDFGGCEAARGWFIFTMACDCVELPKSLRSGFLQKSGMKSILNW